MINHVVSLETAKKLRDYLPGGWESGLIWVWHDNDGRYVLEYKDVSGWAGIVSDDNYHFFYPAATLSEMLELLPKIVTIKNKRCHLNTRFYKDKISIAYSNYDEKTGYFNAKIAMQSTNFATAAALLYMWLVDEGHTGEKLCK